MKIHQIEIQNFKSIHQQVFKFNDVNVLIGANASGKSNFIQVFEFLKSIKKDGIQEAVAMLGGITNIINFNADSKRISIKIEINPNQPFIVQSSTELPNKKLVKNTEKITYDLKLRHKGLNNFEFKEELVFFQYFSINTFEEDEIGNEILKHEKIFQYGVTKDYNGGFKLNEPEKDSELWTVLGGLEQREYQLEFEAPFSLQTIEELNAKYVHRSILEYQGLFMPPDLFDFGIYDINSKVLKGHIDNKYATDLAKDGSNLSIIIKNILGGEDAEQFVADVAGILEFIESIKVVSFENLLELRIKERYNQAETRGNLISDGTVCAIAFIVALYYQDKSIIFIEEPEHSLHPSLIDDIIRAAYDVAEFLDKQIIISTHSPDLLRHLKILNNDLTDLILVSRGENGNSILERPIEKEMVQVFLEAELGLDELFIQNLLND